MRKTALFLVFFFILTLSAANADLSISGRIKLFTSFFLEKNQSGDDFSHDAGEFAVKRLEARLRTGGYLTDNISYSLRFDTFSQPDALFTGTSFPQSSLLGTPTQTEPAEFSLYEAYIKVIDFLFKGLDLTVGKQRIPWGTADRVNVVDNLNPVDFANFFTFDPDYFAERRPQTALNLELYLPGMTKLQFIWLLARQHAPLPYGFSELISTGPIPPEIKVEKDKPLLKNTNFGFRFSTVLLNIDVGLSYYHGNFHLPVLYGLSINMTGSTLLHYKYPEKSVLGFDLSGEAFSVGFWLEGAIVIPERVKSFLTAPVLIGNELQLFTQHFSLFEREYFQYVIGMDYTIGVGNGIYFNAQFLHGFFDERDYSELYQDYFGFSRGMFFGEIEDYLMVSAEYSFLNGDLKIVFGELVEFSGSQTAFTFMPTLEYKVFDYLTIQSGAFLVAGKEEETKFGGFKKDTLAFFALKLNF
jgi:hypothetical protein